MGTPFPDASRFTRLDLPAREKPKEDAQLMLTNPRDAFRDQSRSPNVVPFHTLGIAPSCAIVTLSFVFKTKIFFLIFDFKKMS